MLRSHSRRRNTWDQTSVAGLSGAQKQGARLQALSSGLWLKKKAREEGSFQPSSCGWSRDSHRRIRERPGASRAAGQAPPH